MSEDSTQLEMFSLGEEKKKKKKSYGTNKLMLHCVEQNLVISRHLLIYLILGILVLFVIVYIAGVETGRNWKVDKIYKDYIKGKNE